MPVDDISIESILPCSSASTSTSLTLIRRPAAEIADAMIQLTSDTSNGARTNRFFKDSVTVSAFSYLVGFVVMQLAKKHSKLCCHCIRYFGSRDKVQETDAFIMLKQFPQVSGGLYSPTPKAVDVAKLIELHILKRIAHMIHCPLLVSKLLKSFFYNLSIPECICHDIIYKDFVRLFIKMRIRIYCKQKNQQLCIMRKKQFYKYNRLPTFISLK